MKELIIFKHELQNIINRNEFKGQSNLIKAAQAYLKANLSAGSETEDKQFTRTEEERALTLFANENNLWIDETCFGAYITEGAEQKVYFPENTDYVVKLADAIFYIHWQDYFNNLLLHNALFDNTRYELIGFYRDSETLFAVVKQPFVITTAITNLENVKQFLLANGFESKKNND